MKTKGFTFNKFIPNFVTFYLKLNFIRGDNSSHTNHSRLLTTLNMNGSILCVDDVMNKLDSFDWLHFNAHPDKNKGKRGQAIEIALGLSNNSSLLDLSDGEIKSFTKGESIAVTQLNHCFPDIVQQIPFQQSKIGQKIKNTIYIAFDKNNHYITHKNQFSCFLIEQDYIHISQLIWRAIQNGTKIGTINGPNGFLQIRTKASKKKDGTYAPLVYDNNELNNKGMAFYLKADYGRKICI